MYEITLQGPKTSFTATTDDIALFKRFVLWLRDYGYLGEKVNIGQYKLDADKKVKTCRTKAARLGLSV